MPRKKKDYIPNTIEDLYEIFYGPNKDGKNVDSFRLRRYLDTLRGRFLSPAYEHHVKEMFAPLGRIEKIPENQDHTNFDSKIDSRKLLIEVTSLNITETAPTTLTREDTLRKLKSAIDHILEKDDSPFPSYRKGGVIIYTLIFNFFSGFNKLLNDELPEISGMFNNDLDFLVFFHEPASINNKSSFETYPPVFYVRNTLLVEEFREALKGRNYRILKNIPKNIVM